MEFRFQMGGGVMRQVPVIPMLKWRRVAQGRSTASFRPGWGTIPYRLMVLALAAILGVSAHFVLEPMIRPPEPRAPLMTDADQARLEALTADLGADLDPATRARIEARVAARQQEADRLRSQQETARGGLQVAYTGIMVVLGVCGLLPVVSLAWNRVTLRRTDAGQLLVHRWGVLPRTYTLEVVALGGMRVIATEQIGRGRYGVHRLGWRWRVRLHGHDGIDTAEFQVYQQKDRPREGGRPPEPVKTMVESLHRLTGLQPGPVEIQEAHIERDWRGARVVRAPASPFTVTTDITHGTGHLPPHLREQVDAALRGGGSVPVRFQRSESITVADESGQTRSYASWDAVPPEVRARFEGLRPSGGQAPITVRGLDGKVHHYTSPEELPPELRALFDRVREEGGPTGPKPWE